MAQPTPYNRQFNFQNFQAASPTDPLPANQVDVEFNAIKASLDQAFNNLALIQADDGELVRQSVGRRHLAADVSVGFDAPTVWATGTSYTARSTVFHLGKFYFSQAVHTSGTFETDLAAGKWLLIADFTAVGGEPGVLWIYDTATTTGASPGDGKFKANNANLESATTIAVRVLSANNLNPNVGALLDRWSNAVDHATSTLIVTKVGAAEKRVEYDVTDITAQSGFYQFTVSGGVRIGSFAAGDLCAFLFIDGAADGDTGDAGKSFSWQGAWVTATEYEVNDGVENDGSSYVCTVAHTSSSGTEPGTGASWESNWDLIAAAGTGDVVGPASATDGRIATFDGTTGKLIEDSGFAASDFATADHNHDSDYQPLDADLTALASAGNSSVLAATTASFLTADETKLDGIEALADVTDATNVAAAGAVMELDTTTAAMQFVVDEDDMASDSATKVPTQQSVKAYADSNFPLAAEVRTIVVLTETEYGALTPDAETFYLVEEDA